MKKIILSLLAIAAMTSCTKSSEEEIDPNAPVEIKLNANVLQIQSRALYAATSFPTDKPMGLYIWDTGISDYSKATIEKANNAAINYDGSDFTFPQDESVYWPLGDSGLDFYAYYPQVTDVNLTAATSLSGPLAQITLTEQQDFMFASVKNQNKTKNSTVSLQFKHALSAISIIIKKENISSDVKLEKIEFENYPSTGKMNITTGIISTNASSTSYTIFEAKNESEQKSIVEAGTTIQENYLVWPTDAPKFKITLNGKTIDVTPKTDSNGTLTFTANTKHTITFTVTATGVSVGAAVTEWDPNGSAGSGDIEGL